jgi:hypothetical protein
MRVINFISLAILLTLTTFLISPSKAETCTTNDLGDRTCTTTTAGTTTGNVLTNSIFEPDSSGNYNHGWTESGDIGHGHPSTSGTTYTGQNTSGGVLAFEGDPNGSIYQDVDLVGDGHLTKSQIGEGFTSTMSADVWFWNNVENTLTLKQTITDDNGNVTTQVRNINDYDPNRASNGSQWTNYTDSYTHASNTQAEFTIRAEVYNNTAGTTYDGSHWGPDVDNIELSITTAGANTSTFTPCEELGTCTDAGTAINDAVNLTTDDGVNLFTDLDTKVEDAFKEVKKIDDVKVEEVKFDVIVEDDLGKIEEVEFKEFVEMQFTSFIAENNLVEDFKEELKVEGISEEQFFDELGDSMMEELGGDMMNEIASLNDSEMMMEEPKMEEFKEEEAMTDELVKENKEELIEEKPTEESNLKEEPNATNEEPTNETVKTEEAVPTNEETTEPEGQESEVVSNESDVAEDKETEGQEAKESDSEDVESETDVSVKDRKIASTDIDSIGKKVEKIIAKINEKLKRVDQKLQATSLVISAGLNSNAPDLTAYKNKKLNGGNIPDGNLELFQTINILEQQKIYTDVSLKAYTSKDPIAVKQNALARVYTRINTLQAEIAALKSLQ